MFRFILFAFLTVLYAGLLAWPVRFLWNLVVPQLFHLQAIDYWQSFALVAISRVLFGMRLVGFLIWTTVVGIAGGWVAQWLWNMVGPSVFHLPSVTWLQAGALVGLFQLLVGGTHHMKRLSRRGHWQGCGETWHERIHEHVNDHGRMHKEDWRAFKRHMRGMGRQMREQGKTWKDWADEAAPHGSHRNWKHFDSFWRERGKAEFEAWLEGRSRSEG